MMLQVAFNFNNAHSKILNIPHPPDRIFQTKEMFIAFIIQRLCVSAIVDVSDLFNASCCVYAEEWTMPGWYKECNGKIFFEYIKREGRDLRLDLGIDANKNSN